MNKEQIFDAKIAPLVRDIFTLCSDYGIAMVTAFALPTTEQPGLCSFSSTPDGNGEMPEKFAEVSDILRGVEENEEAVDLIDALFDASSQEEFDVLMNSAVGAMSQKEFAALMGRIVVRLASGQKQEQVPA